MKKPKKVRVKITVRLKHPDKVRVDGVIFERVEEFESSPMGAASILQYDDEVLESLFTVTHEEVK